MAASVASPIFRARNFEFLKLPKLDANQSCLIERRRWIFIIYQILTYFFCQLERISRNIQLFFKAFQFLPSTAKVK